MNDLHGVPVQPLATQTSTRRSRIAIAAVVVSFVAIVAFGLAGPQTTPTPSDAPALVPPASEAPATARASPSTREARLSCLPSPTPFDPATFDLTGVWTGVDGGVYYVSQTGSSVWWNGISDWAGDADGMGVAWTNVGHGTIDDLRVVAAWADVPRGLGRGSGTLALEIQDNGQGNIQIVTRDQSGGFGNTLWLPATCRPL